MINTDSRVRMSRVRGKRSPIMGALVVADVVLEDVAAALRPGEADKVRAELIGGLPARPARSQSAGGLELRAGSRADRRR